MSYPCARSAASTASRSVASSIEKLSFEVGKVPGLDVRVYRVTASVIVAARSA